jgi:hypothetical protein
MSAPLAAINRRRAAALAELAVVEVRLDAPADQLAGAFDLAAVKQSC